MRSRPGFIILFGTKPVVRDDPERTIHSRCPQCGREVDLAGKRHRLWFTLFFLPVIPLSGVTEFHQCTSCGASFKTDERQLQARANVVDSQKNQRAILLYNLLRTSPENPILLNDLMNMYGEMEQYDSAISAAGQFPVALQQAEQCRVTLARVHLARKDANQAIAILDEVLAKNPNWPDAHFFKAVAYLTLTPPRPTDALASARAARAAGHTEAENIIRQAQEAERASTQVPS